MTTPDALRTLEASLAAAEAALTTSDPAAAQVAVEAAVAACQALDGSPHRPTPAQLHALAAVHARVLARAVALHDELGRALEQTGRSRRASAAYRPR